MASSETFLEAMRAVGDAPADEAIERWQHEKRSARLTALADDLVGFDQAPEIPQLLEFLRDAGGVSGRQKTPGRSEKELALDLQEEALAEDLFVDHGLKILMILVFYSLPAAYAASRGVRVLHSDSGGTGFLVKDVNRRLIETTQFVIEVLTAIGPQPTPGCRTPPHDRAVESAHRVRLLHAAVRAMILSHRDPRWDSADLGTPVNQEDMAGTFLTFSWVVIDGMRKLNLGLSEEKERVFYDIWRRMAPLLGVDPRLIPATVAEAEQLTNLIRARQVEAPITAGKENVFGKKMTEKLLEFLRQALPWPVRWIKPLPGGVIRFFLPTSPIDVAASIGVPRTYLLDEIIRLWFFIEARITRYRVFDAVNRLVFKEWGRRDARAQSLMQFSRFFMKRLVVQIQSIDRNEPLVVKARPKRVDLLGWDERWQFDQADFLTRGARFTKRKMSSFRRRSGQ